MKIIPLFLTSGFLLKVCIIPEIKKKGASNTTTTNTNDNKINIPDILEIFIK